MATWQEWGIALGALALLAPAAVWLGRWAGKRAARAYPGAAMALMVFSAFFKIDPPPPPKAERTHKDEEDAGAPPAP